MSSNLAISFAQSNKKVLIIDADMRKGRQNKIFKLYSTLGLSNYLANIENTYDSDKVFTILDYIQKTEIDNLYVMPAGNTPPNPSELLNSKRMSELIERAKNAFDYVIIDGTPCQLVTDSFILTRIVDSTIIVTACKKTKKEVLKRIINNIQKIGGNISGIVLNKMPMSTRKYEERYYYGSESKDEYEKNVQKLLSENVNNQITNKEKEIEKNFEREINIYENNKVKGILTNNVDESINLSSIIKNTGNSFVNTNANCSTANNNSFFHNLNKEIKYDSISENNFFTNLQRIKNIDGVTTLNESVFFEKKKDYEKFEENINFPKIHNINDDKDIIDT